MENGKWKTLISGSMPRSVTSSFLRFTIYHLLVTNPAIQKLRAVDPKPGPKTSSFCPQILRQEACCAGLRPGFCRRSFADPEFSLQLAWVFFRDRKLVNFSSWIVFERILVMAKKLKV
jgi:hypothetical protein